MFFRKRDRETLRRHTAEIQELRRVLREREELYTDVEMLYEKSRTLHARLSKREQRASGDAAAAQAGEPKAAPAINPLALALLQGGRTG